MWLKIKNLFKKKPAIGGIVSRAKEPNLIVVNPSCCGVPESIAEEFRKHFEGGVFEVGELNEGLQGGGLVPAHGELFSCLKQEDGDIKFKQVNEDPCV